MGKLRRERNNGTARDDLAPLHLTNLVQILKSVDDDAARFQKFPNFGNLPIPFHDVSQFYNTVRSRQTLTSNADDANTKFGQCSRKRDRLKAHALRDQYWCKSNWACCEAHARTLPLETINECWTGYDRQGTELQCTAVPLLISQSGTGVDASIIRLLRLWSTLIE